MKLTKQQLKQIIKEEVNEAMIDAYIDNPLDFSMPEDVAFHPRIIKARSQHFIEQAIQCQNAYTRSQGGVDAFNPVHNTELDTDEWALIDDAKEKQKELNRISMQLNKMLEEFGEDFETLQQNPRFQKLNARMKVLMRELANSKEDEREAGRQIGRTARQNIGAIMAHAGVLGRCPSSSTMFFRGVEESAATEMEEWKRSYERKKDRYRPQYQGLPPRRPKPQPPSPGTWRRRRHQENKTMITKSQLRQIVKEELRAITQEGFFSTPKEKDEKRRKKNIEKAERSLSGVEKTLQQYGEFDKPAKRDTLGNLDPSETLRKIEDLLAVAFTNKSLGLNPEVGVGYLRKVQDALKGIE